MSTASGDPEQAGVLCPDSGLGLGSVYWGMGGLVYTELLLVCGVRPVGDWKERVVILTVARVFQNLSLQSSGCCLCVRYACYAMVQRERRPLCCVLFWGPICSNTGAL